MEWIDLDTICLLFGMVSIKKNKNYVDYMTNSLSPSDGVGGDILTDWVL